MLTNLENNESSGKL